MEFTDRVINLTQEGAYTMLSRAQELEAAGREIIHMEIGQPDALCVQLVQIGCHNHVVTVTSEVAVALVVGHYQNHIGAFPSPCCRLACSGAERP